jgi:hypothetical protein
MPASARQPGARVLARVEDDERFGSVVRRTACSPLGEHRRARAMRSLRIAPKDSAAAMREKLASIAELGCRRLRAGFASSTMSARRR